MTITEVLSPPNEHIELLAQPWICDTCGHPVQALMGVVLGGEKSQKQTFCFADWEQYVSHVLHLPKDMQHKLRRVHVHMGPVAAVQVVEGV